MRKREREREVITNFSWLSKVKVLIVVLRKKNFSNRPSFHVDYVWAKTVVS